MLLHVREITQTYNMHVYVVTCSRSNAELIASIRCSSSIECVRYLSLFLSVDSYFEISVMVCQWTLIVRYLSLFLSTDFSWEIYVIIYRQYIIQLTQYTNYSYFHLIQVNDAIF